jgi:hypothetical protein
VPEWDAAGAVVRLRCCCCARLRFEARALRGEALLHFGIDRRWIERAGRRGGRAGGGRAERCRHRRRRRRRAAAIVFVAAGALLVAGAAGLAHEEERDCDQPITTTATIAPMRPACDLRLIGCGMSPYAPNSGASHRCHRCGR